jgi:hypothetical protein
MLNFPASQIKSGSRVSAIRLGPSRVGLVCIAQMSPFGQSGRSRFESFTRPAHALLGSLALPVNFSRIFPVRASRTVILLPLVPEGRLLRPYGHDVE